MTSNGAGTSNRKAHLLTAEQLAQTADVTSGADLTRRHGEGNGVRVHLIVFGVASLAALVLLIVAIAFATSMM